MVCNKKSMAKKKIIISLSVLLIVLMLVFYSFKDDSDKLVSKNTKGYFGSDSAPIDLIILIPTEARYYSKEIKRFQEVLTTYLKEYIENNTIYIRTVPEPELEEERLRYFEVLKKSPKLNIIISPYEGSGTFAIREMLKQLALPYLFFSKDKTSVCEGSEVASNLWNLGVPFPYYLEPYLTSLNERYQKLASDMRYFFYVNDNEKILNTSKIYKSVVEDLGFIYSGAISVDERFEDLYSTIRLIFGKTPDILLTITSSSGRINFFPQSYKLGIPLEMAVALDYGVEEEELRSLGKNVDGVLLPVIYVNDFNSKKNEEFKNKLGIYQSADEGMNTQLSELLPTSSSYKAFLISEILNITLSKMKPIDDTSKINSSSTIKFINLLHELDKFRIDGPSGHIMINSETRGLIQPLHLAEFKDGFLKHIKYIGDISISSKELCRD